VWCPNHGTLHGQILQSSSSSSSSSFTSFISSSCAGVRVGPAHPGSRRGVQWGGVQQPEEHAHCPEQQLLQRVPQQQPGGAAQHAGKGTLAPPAQLWRRYYNDNDNDNDNDDDNDNDNDMDGNNNNYNNNNNSNNNNDNNSNNNNNNNNNNRNNNNNNNQALEKVSPSFGEGMTRSSVEVINCQPGVSSQSLLPLI